MKELIKSLSEPLTKDDVELRIGQTSPKGFSLLLYKTARTDVKRLNESGAIWKNEHIYDSAGLLTCCISVYDTEHGIWIPRSDVGTESQTEAQKGLYSDSFKRAGFRWGIGLELYNAPFIWINWEMKQKGNGRFEPVGFFASNLNIDEYETNNGHFTKLKITYGGVTKFALNQKPEQPKADVNIKPKQIKEITDLMLGTSTKSEAFLAYYDVLAINDLSAGQADDAIKKLQKKKEQINEHNAAHNQP